VLDFFDHLLVQAELILKKLLVDSEVFSQVLILLFLIGYFDLQAFELVLEFLVLL